MKKLIVLLIFLQCCNSHAQETYLKIEWELNKDGITTRYILFLAELSDTLNTPFSDSLQTYPEQQWTQYLVGTFIHDSLAIENPDTAFVEYIPSPNTDSTYIHVCLFATSDRGIYSDKMTSDYKAYSIPPRPMPVSNIFITEHKRWK